MERVSVGNKYELREEIKPFILLFYTRLPILWDKNVAPKYPKLTITQKKLSKTTPTLYHCMSLTNSKIPTPLALMAPSLSHKPNSANLSHNINIMNEEHKAIPKLSMQMAPFTSENGKIFFLMEKEKCIFQMGPSTLDSLQKGLLKEKEGSSTIMECIMRER